MAETRAPKETRHGAKWFLFSLTALCLAGVSIWFGYVQFFTKGLEHLPSKLCEGAVERNLVVQVLPSTRSAEEGAKHQNSGDDLTFYCHVDTSGDSSIWSEARVRPISEADWIASYRGSGGDNGIIRSSADDIQAVAQPDTEQAEVYVPCTPPAVSSSNTSEDYAVITRVEAAGEVKETGTALRQTLTDIAYQLAKHAYKLAECQGTHDFPQELPRYGDR